MHAATDLMCAWHDDVTDSSLCFCVLSSEHVSETEREGRRDGAAPCEHTA